ncbi:MAG TPA: DUF4159 domain-containing protein [Vicinamibacterales bacterium]|jgi:hypothetical protein|nr:DUF4159 domain-containing protein [Vicinamibacterales bacterium]
MPSRRARFLIATVIGGALMIFATGGVSAQRFFREGGFAARYAPAQMPDSSFVICRLAYTQVRREQSGIGWETDYPYAEINLSTRFSELTRTRISRDMNGTPNYYVVRASDDQLFNCPIIVASDAGTIGFTDAQALRLRQYFMKGGVLWADDFWGTAAWENWEYQIGRVLPHDEFPIEDIPLDDPILKSQFELHEVPQITNIQFWRQWGGTTTSERGEDSAVVHFRAIRDSHRRIMVVMTHNTDVADSWEREGEDADFFYQFSPRGYALGVDVLLHVMTH